MSRNPNAADVMDSFMNFGIEKWEWWSFFLAHNDFYSMSDVERKKNE